MNTTAKIDEVLKVINAEHENPFDVLGMHKTASKDGLSVRAYYPNAQDINVLPVSGKRKYKMNKIHDSGFLRP